ncbi:MAG: methylenetetrahydrofolate--tRNA-(uracil(54)-C(5))-methyltransferase (FADH(2)-oxidizing) TrmFO [Acidobacteriota bacterium]|nr:methylenetetrahydrofolate--tRNA-(uracil(54)-C(5))-methyltransferase (FADH(2)-oxidizing) TrmFO [Acidobacteriota bacterium]
MNQRPVHVIGGGLAGAECAFQLARRRVPVVLHEMRPASMTAAHRTGGLAELVCSNSFRSDDPLHAAGLLKREMEFFDSVILSAARQSAVPAGSALAVDRHCFAHLVTSTIEAHPLIHIHRQEVKVLPEGDVVLATGPLTSPSLSDALTDLLGVDHLYFYDSIAPIVDADSLDRAKLFWGSRYGKGGGEDYLNAAMTRAEYHAFHQALLEAEVVPLHEFEKTLFFEGCLPVEELARRGIDTLRFGPMKPVGLTAPDGGRPYAVVQLRQENLTRSHFNLVGFQSRLKWGEQKRVFSMIPGLERAEFVRLGQVHRNTFINAPAHLNRFYRLRKRPRIRLAGQITGVEGYLESAATGLAVGLYIAFERRGQPADPLPTTTAFGALARHLVESRPDHFQPANINYGLFPELDTPLPKTQRRAALAARARSALNEWARRHDSGLQEVMVASA